MSGVTPLDTLTPKQIQVDFGPNVYGPLILYQAFTKLLAKSNAKGGAKFAVTSSTMGQITNMLPFPVTAYGISKAAVNYIAKRIDLEAKGVCAFPF